MKRRILCLMMSLVFVFSIVFSSFSVYAEDFDINDYIEVHTPDVPNVDTDGDLLQDEIDNGFDDEFYNSPDEIDESEKDEETFDNKDNFVTDDNYTGSDQNKQNSTPARKKSIARNSTASINENSENGISAQSEYNSLDINLLENWDIIAGYYPFKITKDNVLTCFSSGFYKYWQEFIHNNSTYGDNAYNSFKLKELYPDLFTEKNLMILKFDSYYLKSKGYSDCYCYAFIYSENDFYMDDLGTVVTDSTKGNYFFAYVGVNSKNTKIGLTPSHFNFPDINYNKLGAYGGSTSLNMATDISIVYTGGHKVYIGDEKVPVIDPDHPYINLDISGMIFIDDNAVDLTWVAGSNDEITDDTEYDVRLFALDMETAPTKLSSDLRYVDLSAAGYTSIGTVNKENQSISGKADLEHIYYYIHHMKAYDDSEESVSGYKFEEFEIRNTCTFVLAFKIKDSDDEYVICADFVYDYEKTIDEAMGAFSVKKDYLDFPDIKDYIEEMPDVKDFLPDGENPGPIDWILAVVKWIGSSVKTFGNNFIGFFRWLKDCVPVAWKNFAIALYNMICDLKSLALYLFKPKTKSIKTIVDKRMPGFTKLVSGVKTSVKGDLPYVKLFGTKFGFDFSWMTPSLQSTMRSLSSAILYLVFGYGLISILGKIFSFKIFGNGSDD